MALIQGDQPERTQYKEDVNRPLLPPISFQLYQPLSSARKRMVVRVKIVECCKLPCGIKKRPVLVGNTLWLCSMYSNVCGMDPVPHVNIWPVAAPSPETVIKLLA